MKNYAMDNKNMNDWVLLDDKESLRFVNELKNETDENHLLNNRVKQAIMRCLSQDEVLYLLTDGKFAIVHLTYSKNSQSDYPWCKEFSTYDEALRYIEITD